MPETKEAECSIRKLNITDWTPDDRPREKFAAQGPKALTAAELLGILIGSGSPHETAVGLMKRILADQNGSLRTLGRMSIEELCRYNGVGPAKAITILAACELGRRRAEEPPEERPKMTSSQHIYEIFKRLEDNDVEEFYVMLLSQSLRLIGTSCIGRGGLTHTATDLRLILREAILSKATAIAICHNHPSGNPCPSIADDQLTARIQRACKTMDIRLIDHLVIGDGTYYSYNDEGKL